MIKQCMRWKNSWDNHTTVWVSTVLILYGSWFACNWVYKTFFTHLYYIIVKLISPVIKVVNEINNYDLIFIVMLPLFSCLSCSDNSLQPCIQSLILSLVLLLHTSETKARPLDVCITLVMIIIILKLHLCCVCVCVHVWEKEQGSHSTVTQMVHFLFKATAGHYNI